MPIIVPPSAAVVPFADLLPYVLPYATSCPDDVAIFNLCQAAIEFTQKTTVLRKYQGVVYTLADVTDYDYVLDPGERVHKLLQVFLDGTEVDVVPPEVGLSLAYREATGPHVFGKLTSFAIHPAPKADLALLTFSAITYAPDATTISADLERYFSAIASGALARLLVMKADWADPGLAGVHRGMFRDAISTAARSAHRGHAKIRRSAAARFY